MKKYGELTRPLLILFVVANAVLLVFTKQLAAKNIDADVPIIGNLVLFVISMLSAYFQIKNLQNPNPQAVVRGVMVATFMKLFIQAAAVITYLVVAGKDKNVNGVLVCMGLYILYTWFDVKISLRLNKKK